MSHAPPPVRDPDTGAPSEVPPAARRRLPRLAIGCAVLLLLSCGGVGLVAVVMNEVFQHGLSHEPAVIAARVGKIADIDIPKAFAPKVSFEMRIPITGRTLLTWALFESDPDHSGFESYVLLAQFYAEVSEDDRDALSQEVHRSMIEQDQIHEDVKIDKEKTETRELTIRGEKAQFLFQQGEGRVSDEKYWIVTGLFRGKQGPAVVDIRANVAKFDREAIEQIVESIR